MPGAFDIPEDRVRSPRTGWTRDHWVAQADYLLDSLEPFASPSYALINLPGRASVSGEHSDGLEGFARSFLLAAFRIAGDGGEGPTAAALIDRYASGITAGVTHRHKEAWPHISRVKPTQPMVEAASIALALHETRPWLWDTLSDSVQDRVAAWLQGFLGMRTWPNNWMLFQTVVEEFLASIGAEHKQEEIVRGLDAADEWYVGDGWYSDGAGRNFDYYIGWAMHLYPLMWTRMAAGGDRAALAAERLPVYRERLRQFLGSYECFIGADGAPVHQGRSLTYRFAAAAPFWLGELFDASPYPSGRARRAASGIARYFAEHGAPDERGLLTLGWHGEHLPMTQTYSGPASPYWASKGFLGLLLPADHDAWTSVEEPLPVEEDDFETAVRPVGWVLSGTRSDGVVRLLNHGSDHAFNHTPPILESDDPHYAPLAFSTATAPDTEESAWSRQVGNHVALVSPEGRATHRGAIDPIGAAVGGSGGWAGSRHVPSFPDGPEASLVAVEGAEIETHSQVRGGIETRVHRVTAPTGWTVREGGYPLAGPRPLDTAVSKPPAARVVGEDGLVSEISAMSGWTGSGIDTASGANAYGAESATPYLSAVHPGGTCWYVSQIRLTRTTESR